LLYHAAIIPLVVLVAVIATLSFVTGDVSAVRPRADEECQDVRGDLPAGKWPDEIRAGIDDGGGSRWFGRVGFADFEQVLNLLILFFLGDQRWDWVRAVGEFRDNRRESTERTMGLGFGIPPVAQSTESVPSTPRLGPRSTVFQADGRESKFKDRGSMGLFIPISPKTA
jgi:hypothetical protein